MSPLAPDTSLLLRLVGLVASCLLLWWLERRHALFAHAAGGRRRVAANLLLTVLVAPTAAAVTSLGAASMAWAFASGGLFERAPLPAWQRAVLGIAVLDFVAWVAHVAMHHTAAGWRFHRVHHSDTTVDVTTSLRQHPFETFWRVGLPIPVAAVLGLTPAVVGAHAVLSAVWAQLEHANVRWDGRVERLLRLVFVTPNMHKWHHSRDVRETDTNYGNILSVWDRLFGTRTADEDLARIRYGLDGLDERRVHSLPSLLGLRFGG